MHCSDRDEKNTICVPITAAGKKPFPPLPLPAEIAHLVPVKPDNFTLFFYSCRGRKCKPIFVQIARQVVKLNASDLRLPSRAWKVKLVGEGADDAGGVFDDTITEMCQVTTESAAFPSAGQVTLWLFD